LCVPSAPQILVYMDRAGCGGDVDSGELAQGANRLPLPKLRTHLRDIFPHRPNCTPRGQPRWRLAVAPLPKLPTEEKNQGAQES